MLFWDSRFVVRLLFCFFEKSRSCNFLIIPLEIVGIMSVNVFHSDFFCFRNINLQVTNIRGLHAQLVWFSIKAESIHEKQGRCAKNFS